MDIPKDLGGQMAYIARWVLRLVTDAMCCLLYACPLVGLYTHTNTVS